MRWTTLLEAIVHRFNTKSPEPLRCGDEFAQCVVACDQRKVVRNARARQTLVP